VLGYARNGFEGLLVVGDLGPVEKEKHESAKSRKKIDKKVAIAAKHVSVCLFLVFFVFSYFRVFVMEFRPDAASPFSVRSFFWTRARIEVQ